MRKLKHQVSFYISEELRNRYQELYPRTLTLLLQRFIKLVVKDRQLFERVFFEEI